MIIFCEVTGEKTQEHISHWLQIPDNSWRKIIAGVSRFPKDKCIIYSSKSLTKYWSFFCIVISFRFIPVKISISHKLTWRRCLKSFKELKAFMETSIEMNSVYSSINGYNPRKEQNEKNNKKNSNKKLLSYLLGVGN